MKLKFQVPEYMQAVEDFKQFEQWKKEASEKYRQEFLSAKKGSDEEARRYADEKLREAGVIEKGQAVNDQLTKVHDLIREKYYPSSTTMTSF